MIVHAVRSDGFAGVERHIARLAAAQFDAGHEVRVLGGDPASMQMAIARDGVAWVPAKTVFDVVRAIRLLPDVDVIHAHMTAAELAILVARSARRIPVVSTRHFAARRGNSALGGLVAPIIRRRIAAQISVSEFVASHVDGDSVVIYAGLEEDALPPRAADRRPVVLVAQRLEQEKHTERALRAFALSGLASLGWTMKVAGAGAMLGQLRELAAELALEDEIAFLGHRSDMPELLRSSSLLLATATREHFGLTVLEAMSAGLPVVAVGSAGHLESVGRVEDPALFDASDVAEAARLLRVLAQDPAERNRYGARLNAVARGVFSIKAQQAATDDVYRSVLK